MKKILFSFFLMSVFYSGLGQIWCPPGATWNYTFIPKPTHPQGGIKQVKYVGDTVFNGILCKNLRSTFIYSYFGLSLPPDTFLSYNNTYSYEQHGVVFAGYAANSFDTIVNFKAAIGDKWLRNRMSGTCNSRRAVTVTDTGRKIINGMSLKMIVTTYTNSYFNGFNTINVYKKDTLIERIMSRINFMFPFYCEDDIPPGVIVDYQLYTGEFLCYKDDNFPTYAKPGVANCDFITSIRELSTKNISFNIYPNPTSANIIIESAGLNSNKLYTIIIIDVLGQTILQSEQKSDGNKLQLNIGHLNSGIYYLQLRDKNGLLANEKVVRE